MLLVELLGTFGKGPGTKPLPVPFGDERRLERDVRNRQRVVEPLGELEGELDVFARGLEVALTPGAARTPLENVGAKPVTGDSGAVGKLERLAQKRLCRVDRRQLVAADAHSIEDVGPLDVGEAGLLRELACPREQLECGPELGLLHARPRAGEERAELELTCFGENWSAASASRASSY